MSSASTGERNGEIVIAKDSLTIDEMELAEEICGCDFEDIEAGKAKATKVLRAFALIGLRRANPDATLADAGKVDVKGLNRMLGERPTGAAGPPATSSSASSPKRAASRSKGSRG